MTDRHYALFANNQHPLQLSFYEEYNRFLRNVHNKQYREDLSAQGERIEEALADRTAQLNQTEGESLSFDDYQDIYIQVMGEVRSKQNFSLNTRSKTGEISDYLEVRRPFGAAQ